MKKFTLVFIAFVLVTSWAGWALPVNAQDRLEESIRKELGPIENIYRPGGTDEVTTGSLQVAVARTIRAALGFLAVIFILLILYGGFLWMTARGNEEQISRAKKTLVASIIGATIILAAFAISHYVLNQLLVATGA